MSVHIPQPNHASVSIVELLLSSSTEVSRRLRLRGRRWSIGASSECAVQLQGFSIRGVHAEIVAVDEKCWLVSLGGTVIYNGQPTSRCELSLGDRFEIGGFRLQVARLEMISPQSSSAAETYSDRDSLKCRDISEPQSGGKQRIVFSQQMRVSSECGMPNQPSLAQEARGAIEPTWRAVSPDAPTNSFDKRRRELERLVAKPHFADVNSSVLREVVDVTKTLDSRIAEIEEHIRLAAQQAAEWAVGEVERSREEQARLRTEEKRSREEEKLEEQRRQHETMARHLELRVAELEESITQARREVQAERQASRMASAQVHQLEHAVTSLKEEKRVHSQETLAQTATFQAAINRLVETLESERIATQSGHDELRVATQTLQNSIRELTGRLTEANQQLSESRAQFEPLRDQLRQVELQRDKSHSDCRALEALLERSHEQIAQLPTTEQMVAISARLENLCREFELLQAERKAVTEDRDGLKNALTQLQLQSIEAEKNYQQSRQEWAKQQQHWSDQENDWSQQQSEWQKEKQELRSQRDQQKQQCHELDERLKKKQTDTAPSQSLDSELRKREREWQDERAKFAAEAENWRRQQLDIANLRASWDEERELLEEAIRQLHHQLNVEPLNSVALMDAQPNVARQLKASKNPSIEDLLTNNIDEIKESLRQPSSTESTPPQSSAACSSTVEEADNKSEIGPTGELPSWWTEDGAKDSDAPQAGRNEFGGDTMQFSGVCNADAFDGSGDNESFDGSATSTWREAVESFRALDGDGHAASGDEDLLLTTSYESEDASQSEHGVIDTAPDLLPSPRKQPPKAESAAEILARMGHHFDEVDDSATQAITPAKPIPTAIKPSNKLELPKANQLKPQPTSNIAGHGDEDEASIEAYMSRLLMRMQVSQKTKEPPTRKRSPSTLIRLY